MGKWIPFSRFHTQTVRDDIQKMHEVHLCRRTDIGNVKCSNSQFGRIYADICSTCTYMGESSVVYEGHLACTRQPG